MSVGLFNYNKSPQWPSEMIRRFEALSYKECEQMSGYIGKAVSTFRCALNLLASSSFLEGTRISDVMKWSAKRAKILSVIGIPFSVFRVQATLEKTAKSIDIDDHEGVLLNSLAVASSSADTLYSVSSVFNAFLDIIGSGPIQILADISTPLSFFMSGIDISSRGMQMSKVSKLYQEIDPAIFLKEEAISMDNLRRRLQRRLGIRKEAKSLKRLISASKKRVQILTDRKGAKLSRLVPKSSQAEVDQLFEWFSVNGKQPLTGKQRQIVSGVLHNIRFDLEKKMAKDTIMMVAALVSLVSLTFFCMQGMGYLPYLAQMVASMIKAHADVWVRSIFDVSRVSLIGKEA